MQRLNKRTKEMKWIARDNSSIMKKMHLREKYFPMIKMTHGTIKIEIQPRDMFSRIRSRKVMM